MMTVIFGAIGISSVAAAVGLTTGQTYLTIAGFIIATGAVLAVLYGKQTQEKTSLT